MDSLTQFTLGSAIGLVTMGRKIGARRAALSGGILATVPDLDVFLPASDEITAYVTHRGFSHSLLVHAALAPVVGEGLYRLFKGLQEQPRWHVYLIVYLIWSTHALLDAMTTYGTQLFWPISTHPFSVSSVFIIDPTYTILLLVVTVWALFRRELGTSLRKMSVIALSFSTLYLVWTLVAQNIAYNKVVQAVDAAGIKPDKITMIPMPFNSFLWRGLVVEGDQYHNVYRSVFDQKVTATIHTHPRNLALEEILPDTQPVRDVAGFSQGNYAMRVEDDGILVSDLRMGVTPGYVFTFRVASIETGAAEMVPPRQLPRVVQSDDFDWLVERIYDEERDRVE